MRQKLILVAIFVFFISVIWGLLFFENQCFYDHAFEEIVLSTQMPWKEAVLRLVTPVLIEHGELGLEEISNYRDRMGHVCIQKLLYYYFGFCEKYFFLFKIFLLACLVTISFLFFYKMAGSFLWAILWSFVFLSSVPVHLSMKNFSDFSVLSIIISLISIFLLICLLTQKKMWWLNFVSFFILVFIGQKIKVSVTMVAALTFFVVVVVLLKKDSYLGLRKLFVLAAASLALVCFKFFSSGTFINYNGFHPENYLFFIVKNRPDYYQYPGDPGYQPHISYSLLEALFWPLLAVSAGWLFINLKKYLLMIKYRHSVVSGVDVKQDYWFIVIFIWFVLNLFFLGALTHSDPRYLIHILLPSLFLLANLSGILLNKINVGLMHNVFFFLVALSCVILISFNFLKDVNRLFSEDYKIRAFYKIAKTVYADKHPLDSISDYSQYAKSLRNYKEFYKNVEWFNRLGNSDKMNYFVNERPLDSAKNLNKYVLLKTLTIDRPLTNALLSHFYARHNERFPVSFHLYKRTN